MCPGAGSPAPSGNKAEEIMAAERRGQSIGAGAHCLVDGTFSARSDTQPWEQRTGLSAKKKGICFPRGLKVNESMTHAM